MQVCKRGHLWGSASVTKLWRWVGTMIWEVWEQSRGMSGVSTRLQVASALRVCNPPFLVQCLITFLACVQLECQVRFSRFQLSFSLLYLKPGNWCFFCFFLRRKYCIFWENSNVLSIFSHILNVYPEFFKFCKVKKKNQRGLNIFFSLSFLDSSC